MTTIVSLFECLDSNDNIIVRIRRAIPLSVLKDNFIEVYQKYSKRFDGKYDESCFNLSEVKIDPNKNPQDYDFILENGFLTYILLFKIIDDNREIGYDEDEEINDFVKEFNESNKINKDSNIFGTNIFGEFGKFGQSILGAGLDALKGYYY